MEEHNGSEPDLAIPRPKNRLVGLRSQIPWVISGVLFVLLSASWAFRWSNECSYSSFERGFHTELGEYSLTLGKE